MDCSAVSTELNNNHPAQIHRNRRHFAMPSVTAAAACTCWTVRRCTLLVSCAQGAARTRLTGVVLCSCRGGAVQGTQEGTAVDSLSDRDGGSARSARASGFGRLQWHQRSDRHCMFVRVVCACVCAALLPGIVALACVLHVEGRPKGTRLLNGGMS